MPVHITNEQSLKREWRGVYSPRLACKTGVRQRFWVLRSVVGACQERIDRQFLIERDRAYGSKSGSEDSDVFDSRLSGL
jgi:hypothetical protein